MHDPDSKVQNSSERMDEDESSGATTIEGGDGEDAKTPVTYAYDANNQQLVSSLSTKGDRTLGYDAVPSNVGRDTSALMASANLPPSTDFEAQVRGRMKEEKQRDVSECFGFKDDDEEDEAILSMPSNALN